jgi:hypothetical protein
MGEGENLPREMEPAGGSEHSLGVVQNPSLPQDSPETRVEVVKKRMAKAIMGVGKRIVRNLGSNLGKCSLLILGRFTLGVIHVVADRDFQFIYMLVERDARCGDRLRIRMRRYIAAV